MFQGVPIQPMLPGGSRMFVKSIGTDYHQSYEFYWFRL